MRNYPSEETLRNQLKQHSGNSLIISDGRAVCGLNGDDKVIIIEAAEGMNFSKMTDEEVNAVIVDTLTQ